MMIEKLLLFSSLFALHFNNNHIGYIIFFLLLVPSHLTPVFPIFFFKKRKKERKKRAKRINRVTKRAFFKNNNYLHVKNAHDLFVFFIIVFQTPKNIK